jgi:hypothetical protein
VGGISARRAPAGTPVPSGRERSPASHRGPAIDGRDSASPRAASSIESADQARYTVDASVFVTAFNLNDDGHAQSLDFLAALQQSADPVIVPPVGPRSVSERLGGN